MGLYVVDGGRHGAVHLLPAGLDAHPGKLGKVIVQRLGRIVGQEGIANAHTVQFSQEIQGERKDIVLHIDGPIHIEGNVAQGQQLFAQFVIHLQDNFQ